MEDPISFSTVMGTCGMGRIKASLLSTFDGYFNHPINSR